MAVDKWKAWVHLHVQKDYINRTATIRPAAVNFALAVINDITNLDAMKYRSLLHSVNGHLHRNNLRFVWPGHVPFFNSVDIVTVRKMLDTEYLLVEHGTRNNPAPCDCCQPLLRRHYTDTQLQVKCLADPVERDGCLHCEQTKQYCSERIHAANGRFVSSRLSRVKTERQAAGTMLELVRRLVGQAGYLSRDGCPERLRGVMGTVKQLLVGPGGMRAAEERWKGKRAKIGSENKTRMEDGEAASYRPIRR